MAKSGNHVRRPINSFSSNRTNFKQQRNRFQVQNRRSAVQNVVELAAVAIMVNVFKSITKSIGSFFGFGRVRKTQASGKHTRKWTTVLNTVTGKKVEVPTHNLDYFLSRRTDRWVPQVR